MNVDLIEAARRGDLQAFNQLVLEHQSRIFNHAYRMLGDFHTAEDVTQETFIRAFRKIHQFRGGSFRSWLLRIATNLCYDEMRFKMRNPVQPLEPELEEDDRFDSPFWMRDTAPLPDEAYETVELGEQLQKALDRLSPDFRTTVSLVDIQGFDYAEAAQVMNVSIGTVKSRLARARAQLRQTLAPLAAPGEDRFAFA